MTELAFISLKTMDGKPCGFVRLTGGLAEIRLLEPLAGQAAVLTDSGVFAGNAGSRIAFSGRVLAVALHRDGRLLCMGLSRGAAITPERIRAQLTPELTPLSDRSRREPQPAARETEQSGERAAAAAPTAAPAFSKPRQTMPREGAALAAKEALESVIRPAAGEADRSEERDSASKAGRSGERAAARETEQNGERAAARETEQNGERAAARETEQSEERAAARETEKSGERAAAAAPTAAPAFSKPRQTEANRRNAELEPKETGAIAAAPPMEPEEPAPAKTGLPRLEKRGLSIGESAASDEKSAVAAEQTAADTESFMALLRRADRAFAAVMHREPPVVPAAAQLDGMRRGARYEPAGAPRTAPAVRQSAPASPPPQQAAFDAQSAPVQGTPLLNGRRLYAEPNAAGDWYDEVERLLEDEPTANRSEPITNPFPNIFPGAKFLRIRKPGVSAYLSGDWYSGRGPAGERMRITAVPGAYSPRPPAHLTGFTRYIRARTGGYWIRVEAWDEP